MISSNLSISCPYPRGPSLCGAARSPRPLWCRGRTSETGHLDYVEIKDNECSTPQRDPASWPVRGSLFPDEKCNRVQRLDLCMGDQRVVLLHIHAPFGCADARRQIWAGGHHGPSLSLVLYVSSFCLEPWCCILDSTRVSCVLAGKRRSIPVLAANTAPCSSLLTMVWDLTRCERRRLVSTQVARRPVPQPKGLWRRVTLGQVEVDVAGRAQAWSDGEVPDCQSLPREGSTRRGGRDSHSVGGHRSPGGSGGGPFFCGWMPASWALRKTWVIPLHLRLRSAHGQSSRTSFGRGQGPGQREVSWVLRSTSLRRLGPGEAPSRCPEYGRRTGWTGNVDCELVRLSASLSRGGSWPETASPRPPRSRPVWHCTKPRGSCRRLLCCCWLPRERLVSGRLFHRFPRSIDHSFSMSDYRKLILSTFHVSDTKTKMIAIAPFHRLPRSIDHD